MDLDDGWNKERMEHQGRHPNAYHEYILERMRKIDADAQGDVVVFKMLFEELKMEVRNNPDMLYKKYWKERKKNGIL